LKVFFNVFRLPRYMRDLTTIQGSWKVSGITEVGAVRKHYCW